MAWASVVCQLEPVKGDRRLAIPPGALHISWWSWGQAIPHSNQFLCWWLWAIKMQKQVKGKVKFLLNVKVKVFYFGYKRQQKDKSVLVLTQTMLPTMIPGQFYKQQYKNKSVLMLTQTMIPTMIPGQGCPHGRMWWTHLGDLVPRFQLSSIGNWVRSDIIMRMDALCS